MDEFSLQFTQSAFLNYTGCKLTKFNEIQRYEKDSLTWSKKRRSKQIVKHKISPSLHCSKKQTSNSDFYTVLHTCSFRVKHRLHTVEIDSKFHSSISDMKFECLVVKCLKAAFLYFSSVLEFSNIWKLTGAEKRSVNIRVRSMMFY